MYVYADMAMWKRQRGEVPFLCSGIRMMQQPGLGALSPSQLLTNVIPPPGGDSVPSSAGMSPVLLGGVALLGLGLLIFYGRKVQRSYSKARTKRLKKRARIKAIESELALARAS